MTFSKQDRNADVVEELNWSRRTLEQNERPMHSVWLGWLSTGNTHALT